MSTVNTRRGHKVVIKMPANIPLTNSPSPSRPQTLNDRFSQLRNVGANAKAIGATMRRTQQRIRGSANRFATVMNRRTGRPKDVFTGMIRQPIKRGGNGFGIPGRGRLGRGGTRYRGRGGRGGSRGGRGGGGAGRGGNGHRGGRGGAHFKVPPSNEELNQELESYMQQGSKRQTQVLDNEMEEYMKKK